MLGRQMLRQKRSIPILADKVRTGTMSRGGTAFALALGLAAARWREQAVKAFIEPGETTADFVTGLGFSSGVRAWVALPFMQGLGSGVDGAPDGPDLAD